MVYFKYWNVFGSVFSFDFTASQLTSWFYFYNILCILNSRRETSKFHSGDLIYDFHFCISISSYGNKSLSKCYCVATRSEFKYDWTLS